MNSVPYVFRMRTPRQIISRELLLWIMDVEDGFRKLERISKKFQEDSYEVEQLLRHAKDSRNRISDSHPEDFRLLKELGSLFENDLYWSFYDALEELQFWEDRYTDRDYITLYRDLKELLKTGREFRDFMEKFLEQERRLQIEKFCEYIQRYEMKHEEEARNKAEKILRDEIRNGEENGGHELVEKAVERGYLEGGDALNAWKDVREIVYVTGEELDLAEKLLKALEDKIEEHSERIEERPQILISEEVLQAGNNVVKHNTAGSNPRETSGQIEMEKIEDGLILLKDFENIESKDYEDSTIPNMKKQMEMNSDKNLIFWHSHPSRKGDDTLSRSDLKGMSRKGGFGSVPLKQEVGIIALPWTQDDIDENIVWVAGMVSMNGENLGYYPIHIVKTRRNEENEIEEVRNRDHIYSWVQKYNRGIKIAMMTDQKRYGPYRVQNQVKIPENLNF